MFLANKWEKKGVPFFSSDCQRLLVVISFIVYYIEPKV